MFGKVKVGNRELELCANAATAVRYRQVFRKNILSYFLGNEPAEESAAMVQELAYIMAKSAEKADMNKLSFEDYCEWLEGFEGFDFLPEETVQDIMAIYQGNETPTEESKKKQDRPKEK